MKHDLLLEIQTEELPPKSLKLLTETLSNSICKGLEKANLTFKASSQILASPRRLAVIIHDIPAKQPKQVIERKGPLVSMAFDNKGKPKPQATGFAKSCGVTVKELKQVNTPKGKCLSFVKKENGKKTTALLPDIINEAIKTLPVPKQMRWGSTDTEFARPVHSVILLYGQTVVHTEILGTKTGNQTAGHRVYALHNIAIRSPKSYINALKRHKVIVDFEERKNDILKQTEKLAKKHDAKIIIDEMLLEEVAASVEWPVALWASFPEEFLTLPKEVLTVSIEKHQRCFPVANQKGQLLSNFVTISNIQPKSSQKIIKGNERVMNARLADASFFFESDKKIPLSKHIEELKQVIFQAKLGSLFDKTERIKSLAQYLAETLKTDPEPAERAAWLSKTDLMTQMVGEFPELQGIMGRYYATYEGIPAEVTSALEEQYKPRFSVDTLPETITGQILAIADRMDTLVGMFGIKKIPTGNKDPFGLRRAALGVIRIIIGKGLHLNFNLLVQQTIRNFQHHKIDLPHPNVGTELGAFFLERIANWALQNGFTHDQYAAALGGPIWHDDLLLFFKRIDAVKYFSTLPEAANLAAANKRVSNILSKQAASVASNSLKIELLQEEAEIELATAIAEKLRESEKFEKNHEYCDLLVDLASLQPSVDRFFDEVMVMVEDEAVRQNRLALLAKLRALFLKVADVSMLAT